jgi:predicted MPP superfamily phosphohydrolase
MEANYPSRQGYLSALDQARRAPRANRRGPLKAAIFKIAEASALWVANTIPAAGVEREQLTLESVHIPINNLPPAFDGYRIVQLTDFHFSDPVSYEVGCRAVEIAMDLAPDLIVMTGDVLTQECDSDAIIETFTSLHAPDGVWAILGNHDYWEAPGALRATLARCGIHELCNTNVALRRGDQALWLAGIDDLLEGYPDLESTLAGIPDGAATILLAHEPDFVLEASRTGCISAMLAGHSHGGQVVIPGLRPILLPEMSTRYWQGMHRVDDTWLYVSRGVGTHSNLRLNCKPEVTEITLVR